MKVARVVGNVVSTIKDKGFYDHKLLIVEFLDENGKPEGVRQIAFDVADAGVGDTVLVCIDGGAATIFLGNDREGEKIIGDATVCGVIDYATFDGRTVAGNTAVPKL